MPAKDKLDFGLYFITDSKLSKKNVLEDTKAAISGGVKIVQYREKEASTKQMIEEAKEIKSMCKRNNVLFLVNDRIDVALAVDADGVHLGQEDMPYKEARKLLGKSKVIGLSAHNIDEAFQNQKIGADYTSIGPIYHTETKKGKSPIGLKPIRQLRKNLKIPFVAIGGIDETNIKDVLNAGARNIAIISGIVTKHDVKGTVREFISKINLHK